MFLSFFYFNHTESLSRNYNDVELFRVSCSFGYSCLVDELLEAKHDRK